MTAIKGGGASKGRLIPNAETAQEAASIEREHSDLLIDSALTWTETIPWLRSQTSMKIILKGVLTAEDAHLAVEAGVDAIIVSSHGGRQLDSVPATLEALPEVSDAVKGRISVLFDGGISKGTDVCLQGLGAGRRPLPFGEVSVMGRSCEWATRRRDGVEHPGERTVAYNGAEWCCVNQRYLKIDAGSKESWYMLRYRIAIKKV